MGPGRTGNQDAKVGNPQMARIDADGHRFLSAVICEICGYSRQHEKLRTEICEKANENAKIKPD
jgi:hypothetical protein